MRSVDDIRSYLICGTPRTGSTLLCHLLASTGVAGRPESYFRVPDEQSWADRWQLPRDATGSFDYRTFVRAVAVAGRTPNGVFGARVMWGSRHSSTLARLPVSYGRSRSTTQRGGAGSRLPAYGRTRCGMRT